MNIVTMLATRDRYDPATKIWTTVLMVLIAGIVDWFAVVMPVRDVPAHDPNVTGWWVALLIAVLPPICWIVGHVIRRSWDGLVIWLAPLGLIVCAQLVLLEWSSK